MKRPPSLLRYYEYQELSKLSINGKILDVGGSYLSGYLELIKGEHEIVVGNINPAFGIDFQMDAAKPFPFDNDTFDGVLMINFLEHLFEYEEALKESLRVLKPGGKLVGVVPFLFNVHGSPSDYFRYTKFALERLSQDVGYSSICIKELGTGAWSVIFHLLFGFYHWPILARMVANIFTALDKIFQWIKPGNLAGPAYMPLGYYFEMNKK